MAIQSVRATHFSCYNMEAIIYNVQMSEQDNVPIKLYLQKQAMGSNLSYKPEFVDLWS